MDVMLYVGKRIQSRNKRETEKKEREAIKTSFLLSFIRLQEMFHSSKKRRGKKC